jgi:hypothetical protein
MSVHLFVKVFFSSFKYPEFGGGMKKVGTIGKSLCISSTSFTSCECSTNGKAGGIHLDLSVSRSSLTLYSLSFVSNCVLTTIMGSSQQNTNISFSSNNTVIFPITAGSLSFLVFLPFLLHLTLLLLSVSVHLELSPFLHGLFVHPQKHQH